MTAKKPLFVVLLLACAAGAIFLRPRPQAGHRIALADTVWQGTTKTGARVLLRLHAGHGYMGVVQGPELRLLFLKTVGLSNGRLLATVYGEPDGCRLDKLRARWDAERPETLTVTAADDEVLGILGDRCRLYRTEKASDEAWARRVERAIAALDGDPHAPTVD